METLNKLFRMAWRKIFDRRRVMPCHEVTDRISGFLDQDLDPPTMVRIREHMDSCAACRNFCDSLDHVAQSLSADPSRSLPEEEVERMMRTLRQAYQDAVEELEGKNSPS